MPIGSAVYNLTPGQKRNFAVMYHEPVHDEMISRWYYDVGNIRLDVRGVF